ncbi:hypothetical protein OIU77_029838 [Salix suchowensis]|uniref:Uncharacterized protein n=1 Tax=Salix suchowensis TaxID=1278906 RepID=A0ABQ9BBK7_9ROSI|nr:hypothetical protein OIU77_029838 [Salix suchowensis]
MSTDLLFFIFECPAARLAFYHSQEHPVRPARKNQYTHSAFLSNFPQALFMHVNLCLFYVINYSKL